MNTKGSVILHVLVTGIVVALIASLLLRMTMLRHTMTSRAHQSTQMRRDDEMMLASILSSWNSANGGAGQVCAVIATFAPPFNVPYNWSGTPGTCGCAYWPVTQTNPARLPSVTTSLVGGKCQIQIVSADRP